VEGAVGSALVKRLFDAAAEVNERTGDDRADALKDEEAGAWIDIRIGLALKGEAERNKKRQGNREIF
jgi:hypothetical protein